MTDKLVITSLNKDDLKEAIHFFETTIPIAFEKEGLGNLTEDIENEITHKKVLLESMFKKAGYNKCFLVAKIEEKIIGTISFGTCGKEINDCLETIPNNSGELGSIYVLPNYQGKGVASALIKAMSTLLYKNGVKQFLLDCGFKGSQKKWIQKFGQPYKVVIDYWGEGSDHMIWLCKTDQFMD